MATYCRITGKSRGLPKPNYFPLLPPISPADAKRFCRITGKAYGLPSHHYIPVLVSKPRKDKKKSPSDKPHLIIAGYRYFFPCLDSDPNLTEILNEKKDPSSSIPDARYVYTVKERNCGLVFSSKLEAAVRDGDVRDVMLAKDSDTVLLKLKKGVNISLDVKEINIESVGQLYEGEGAASVDCKKKKNAATRAIREIFESKDADIESEREITKDNNSKKIVQRSWKNAEPSNFQCPQPAFEVWKWGDFEKGVPDLLSEQGIVVPTCFSSDYAGLDIARVSIPLEAHNPQINGSLITSISQISPGDLEKTFNLENGSDFQHLPSISSLPEIAALLSNGLIKNPKFRHPQGICITKTGLKLLIVGQFVATPQGETFVPGKTIETSSGKKFIPGVAIATSNGLKLIPGMFASHDGKVEFSTGHILETKSGALSFVPGQLTAEDGVFQPGQTIATSEGIKFVPGQAVEGRFIPGQIVQTETGRKFYMGQYEKNIVEILRRESLKASAMAEITDGLAKVSGQPVAISNLATLTSIEAVSCFNESKSVIDNFLIESVSKIPDDALNSTLNVEVLEKTGLLPDFSLLADITPLVSSGKPKTLQVNGCEVTGIEIDLRGQKRFIVGQHVDTPQGTQFIPGQSITTESGKLFIPGIVLLTETGVKLLPGVINRAEGGPKFTAGQIIETSSGKQFIAGQIIEGKFTFGTTILSPEGIKFIPGAQSGETFVPCNIVITENGPQILKSHSVEADPKQVPVHEINPINIKPIDVDVQACYPGIIQQPCITSECASVETVQIVAPFKPFMPVMPQNLTEAILGMSKEQLEKTSDISMALNEKLLPSCSEVPSLIPLIKSGIETVEIKDGKEVHGIKVSKDGKEYFIVGQTVNGEFIPGKTTNTSDGPIFTPAMVIMTENGVSLLPGAIFEVQGQPEFILGQITSTNAGETFVPGQIVSSVDGKKFLPGQTITSDGIKFIPGQIVGDRFIPGQIVNTEDNQEFIAGQTVQVDGNATLVPGQSMWTENGWEFVPGLPVGNGPEKKFIPGRHMKINGEESASFVPGQYTLVNGEEVFTPGICVQSDDGIKFVSGVKVKDADGNNHFVQGRVINESGVHRFIPGVVKTEGNRPVFEAAQGIEEIPILNTDDFKLNEVTDHTTSRSIDGVLGHIVQSSHGVEFFPGSSKCLPKGKVVPGKLIREDGGVKFIPGLMVQGEFVPGQVVMTETGEKFIPGQVIDTNEGPKFVPGKIIKTCLGDKFVPGQTIETEEGPKFLPGQIVETKAGPTFIPGQVIHTDEGGSKFVPGQVVDTSEGPRFVPGRVVEAGDQVVFIPGQIVETVDGLHFIAPDLTGENENSEFTVQGFDISPEELKLIQPKNLEMGTVEAREMAINSRMLRQLSEAGMSVGHQVDTEVPDVNVCTAPAIDAACKLANKLKLDPVTTVKLSEIIGAVVRIGVLGEINGTKEEVSVINGILERVIHCKSSEETYKLICHIIEKEMSSNIQENVDKIYQFLLSNESPLKKLNKVHAMKDILNCNISTKDLLGKMSVVLSDEDESVCYALQRFSEVEPEIISQIVQRFSDTVGKLETEREVIETLHRAIVATVRQSSEQSIVEMLKDTENLDMKTLILEAIGLAKALDMQDTAASLTGILSDPKCTNILGGDRVTLEILRRLTVMRRLAERRPELLASLKNLHLDPYGARTDPGLKQLVRESAALLVVPEEGLSAQEIPSSLFFSQNSIAMEDFLYKTKRPCNILVIIKNGLQAVIPREAAHSVLTGSVPYVVLDEKGIRYFQPKHVFSALKLPKICTNWFSLYKCEFKDIVTY